MKKSILIACLGLICAQRFQSFFEITVDELKKKLVEKPRQVSLKELNNISQY